MTNNAEKLGVYMDLRFSIFHKLIYEGLTDRGLEPQLWFGECPLSEHSGPTRLLCASTNCSYCCDSIANNTKKEK